MVMSISGTTKRRGRPVSTGTGVGINVRLQPDQLAALDAWIAKQPDKPSRPEAVRQLIQKGMGGS